MKIKDFKLIEGYMLTCIRAHRFRSENPPKTLEETRQSYEYGLHEISKHLQ